MARGVVGVGATVAGASALRVATRQVTDKYRQINYKDRHPFPVVSDTVEDVIERSESFIRGQGLSNRFLR